MNRSNHDRSPGHLTKIQCRAGLGITGVSLAMIIAHALWPDRLPLDNGTLILSGVAALPWLALFWQRIKIGNDLIEAEHLDANQALALNEFGASLAHNLQKLTADDVVGKLVNVAQPEDVRNVLWEAVARIKGDIQGETCLSVDLRALGDQYGIKIYPVAGLKDLAALTAAVSFALNPAGRPQAYGRDWLLRKKNAEATGRDPRAMRDAGLPSEDFRRLKDLDITAGAELEVVRLD